MTPEKQELPSPTELVGYLMSEHSEYVTNALKQDAACFQSLEKGSDGDYLITVAVVAVASIAAADPSVAKQALKYGLQMAKEARNAE